MNDGRASLAMMKFQGVVIGATAFCLTASAPLPAGEKAAEPVAGEIFSASFDKSLDADKAAGAKAPLKASKIQLVKGVRGEGAAIPADGALDYAARGNISADEGTLAMWIKLNWTPEGTGTFLDRPGPGEPFRKTAHSLFSASRQLNPSISTWLGGFPVINQLFAGDWNHAAFSWSAERQTFSVYLNGELVNSSKYAKSDLSDALSIGSVSGLTLGLDGTVDELKAFNRELKGSEVKRLRAEAFPVAPVLLDYVGVAGKKGEFLRIRFLNLGDERVDTVFSAVVSSRDGKKLSSRELKVSTDARSEVMKKLEFETPEPGDFLLTLSTPDGFKKTFLTSAISPRSETESMPLSESGKPALKLLEELDLVQPLPDSKYRDDGNCRVASSKAGAYRETTLPGPNSGFAVRMNVEKPGRPHWLELDYPDDANRIFSLAVYPVVDFGFKRVYSFGSSDTLGVITGGEHPVSNSMQTKRLLFWPDSKEILVACCSFKLPGEAGAAASKIRLFENEGPLPRLSVNEPEGLPARSVVIWNEDPQMDACNWFNRPECWPRSGFEFWKVKASRMTQQLRFSGQSACSLLALEYEGDNTGSLGGLLPASPTTSANGRIPGWLDLVATTFDRERLPFYIELNQRVSSYLGVGSLGKTLGEDALAGRTRALKFIPDFEKASAKGAAAVEEFTGANALAGDGGPHSSGGLNPLHPEVQAAYLKIVAAYREKFSRYDEFQGLDLTSPVQIAFDKGLDCGYSDFTTRLFESENGVSIPVQNDAKDRFSRRKEWLEANEKERWISWRCDKIRDFYARLLKELNSNGVSGKKIVARIDVSPKSAMRDLSAGAEPQPLSGAFREFGLDLEKLGKLDGLILLLELSPNRERTNPSGGSSYYCFSPALAAAFREQASPAALICQNSNLEVYWTISKLKLKPLWWPVGTFVYDNANLAHFSTPQPDNAFVLENMAWTLAEADPRFIEHGFWGCPENGDYEDYQRFHKAFRSIPAIPFEKAGGSDDPAVVRVHNAKRGLFGLFKGGEGDWLQIVNKSWRPVKISLELGERNSTVRDAVAGADLALPGGKFEKELKGFEVLVFKLQAPAERLKVVQTPQAGWREELERELAECERKLSAFKKIHGAEHAACRRIVDAARGFLEAGEPCQAEHRLRSEAFAKLDEELACDLKVSLNVDGTLALRFVNCAEKEVSGSLRLVDWPARQRTTPRTEEALFKSLAPGKPFEARFEFDGPGFSERVEQSFKIELRIDGKAPALKTVKITPLLALKARTPKIDTDLSDWQDQAAWIFLDSDKDLRFQGDDPRKQPGFSPWKAKVAATWNEKGVAIAVETEDKDFIPPLKDGAFYEGDSLQIYFDQFDNKSSSYDDNDLVYQAGLQNGKARVWRERAPSGQSEGFAQDVEAAIKREDGKTRYEIFIPASEFAKTGLLEGGSLGFAVLVNNKDMTANGELRSQLSTSARHPFRTPDAWGDLLLAERPPVNVEARVSSANALEAADGSRERLAPAKAGTGKLGSALLFKSNALKNGAWSAESFSFIPKEDGEVKLELLGSWRPEGDRLPAVWVRAVRIEGAGTPALPLERWSALAPPEIRPGVKGSEAKLDFARRIALSFHARKGEKITVLFEAAASAETAGRGE